MNFTLKTDTNQIERAIDILSQLKNDPKAQKCLEIYQKMPEEKQDVLLIAMDAFVMGAEAARQV